MTGADGTLPSLLKIRLFKGLAEADLESLLPSVRRRRFARGTYIFREGDPGDQLFLIVTGAVKISRTTEAGDEAVFAVLGEGEAFGELAVLEENALRSADATALSETECLLILRSPVVAFLQSHPSAMWRVVTVLSDYIRSKDETFADLAFHDIPGRVARKLLELASARGETVEAGVEVRLSQETLAGLVGASRGNVNRALSRFVSLGYIKLERGRIGLLRPDELRRRSG